MNENKSASLYVGDLNSDVTEAFLYEIFKEAGTIVSIKVGRDSITRESLGYAHVHFMTHQDAERALQSLNYTVINDKPIRIMWAHHEPALRKPGVGSIIIEGLDSGIDNRCLHDTFSSFGQIISVKVQHTQGSKTGLGYVFFSNDEEAQRVIDKVDGKQINGRIVSVKHYRPTPNQQRNDDGRFGGRGRSGPTYHQQLPTLHNQRNHQSLNFDPVEYEQQQQQQEMLQQRRSKGLSQQERDQKHLIGETLFPIIYKVCKESDEAGKITGMMLEIDNTELIELMKKPEKLKEKIDEAITLLRTHEGRSGVKKKNHHHPNNLTKVEKVPSRSTLAKLNKKDQKRIIGEHLYPLVYRSCQQLDFAGRVTGMLLEMDNDDLLHLLSTPELLKEKINEAEALLRTHEKNKEKEKELENLKTIIDIQKKEIEEKNKKIKNLKDQPIFETIFGTILDLDSKTDEQELEKRIETMDLLFENIKKKYEDQKAKILVRITEINSNLCKLCYERPSNIVFSCGHLYCENCSEMVKDQCSFCRKIVSSKIKLYRN